MKFFTTTKAALIAGLMLVTALGLWAKGGDPVVSKAQQFITLLQKGNYSSAYQEVDSNLGFKITPEKLGAVWQKLTDKAGPLVELKKTSVQVKNGYYIVTQVAQFKKGNVDIKVALNNMLKVADFAYSNHESPKAGADQTAAKTDSGDKANAKPTAPDAQASGAAAQKADGTAPPSTPKS